MKDEIIFTQYQADVFSAAERLLKTQGYLGESLFEDTYVLSKKLAQYVATSIPSNGTDVAAFGTKAYNAVLGIRARGGLEPGAKANAGALGGALIDQSLIGQTAVFNPNSKGAGKSSKFPTSPLLPPTSPSSPSK